MILRHVENGMVRVSLRPGYYGLRWGRLGVHFPLQGLKGYGDVFGANDTREIPLRL